MALLERKHQDWETEALTHIEQLGFRLGQARFDLAGKQNIVVHTDEGDKRVYLRGSSLIAKTFWNAYHSGRAAA